jgi:predicted CXXCH cytochrome family protein
LLIGLAVALMLLLAPAAALADNGPHGGYTATNTPDGCAACHRAHTAKNDMLLVASDAYDLCTSCHGSNATGAQTNVIDGLYAEGVNDPGGQGRGGGGLLAGGFVNTVMNTDFATAPAPHAVTSKHTPDGSTGTVWGFGNFSATANVGTAGFALECTNCHNPHGNSGPNGEATYRILRSSVHAPTPVPTNPVPGSAYVADQATKSYTVAAANQSTPGNYFDQSYKEGTSNARAQAISAFCGACHTRHVSTSRTDTGDAVYTFRHTSSGTSSLNCVTCHVAHGSSAAASGLSTSAGVSGGGAMLRLDDRGVCANCHVSSSDWNGPVVTSVTPSPVSAGATLTINGRLFLGTGGGRVRIYAGTAAWTNTNVLTGIVAEVSVPAGTAWTASQVTITVPTLVAGTYSASVLPNGYRDAQGNGSSRQSKTGATDLTNPTAFPSSFTVQ